MNKNRLEAFSDAVLAIIITIMVLELQAPEDAEWHALVSVLPTLFSYLLSFVYVGIYWNNHHHMLQLASVVNGSILWANLHLLFWLSLLPFTTSWTDETDFAMVPVIVYGLNLLLAALAYFILQSRIVAQQGAGGALALALGRDWKGRLSPLIYVAGMALALINPLLGMAAYSAGALLWFVPDRRVERAVIGRHEG